MRFFCRYKYYKFTNYRRVKSRKIPKKIILFRAAQLIYFSTVKPLHPVFASKSESIGMFFV